MYDSTGRQESIAIRRIQYDNAGLHDTPSNTSIGKSRTIDRNARGHSVFTFTFLPDMLVLRLNLFVLPLLCRCAYLSVMRLPMR